MSTEEDPVDRAIQNLWQRHTFEHAEEKIEVALLVRKADWRPVKANWWRGKEACIIGADLGGNFLLRHCDGTVRYWNHRESKDTVLAPSVNAFLAGLS